MIGGRTRLFALLGDPVAHSLSPPMHNAAFRVLGLDAVYVALPCAQSDVAVLMRALANAGGGGNVTVPYKDIAERALAIRGPNAEALGVCNTFWSERGHLAGETTDVEGVEAALTQLEVEADAWLLIGTGGSARAVVAAARARGARVAVQSRSPVRAAEFARWAAGLGVGPAEPAEARFVVNATPLGLIPGDPLPSLPEATPHAVAALDLVYGQGGTPWVAAQRAAGRRVADGRDVLLYQGVAGFRRWFPNHPPPLDVMRAALRAALG